MVFLQGVGVSTSIAVRTYKKYGDASISVVKNEPYRLAAGMWGIGFPDNGYCYRPTPRLVADAVKTLDVPLS